MAEYYNIRDNDFAQLIQRVDIVPVSLALSQSAIESGWGSSRFTREGNAYFGQWVNNDKAGIIPQNRDEGATHAIRKFKNPTDSIISYIYNLNTHRAYSKFRRLRQQAREEAQTLNSMTLANGLKAYSEKGELYIRLIHEIIQINNLQQYDDIKSIEHKTAANEVFP